MFLAHAIGPTLDELRPLKPATATIARDGEVFPVHPDLPDRLLAFDPASTDEVDPVVAHALSVCSAYAYAEVVRLGRTPDTLARMMARLGLPSARVLMVAERIDPAFIVASGFVVQSEDGRVVILAYRGTEPFDVASWLTDADLHNGPVSLLVGGTECAVHPGFYRNVRAIRSPLVEALDRARRGLSVIDGSEVGAPMQVLHLTGHSLGAAMATLQAVLLLNDPDYAELAAVLRSVHGFGQPMVGAPSLAGALTDTGQASRFLTFTYRRDVVPGLPPIGLGTYAHVGAQFEVADDGGIRRSDRSRGQATFFAIPIATAQFVSHRLPVLRHLPFPHSLDDHLPLNYVEWLAPAGCRSEYGGYPSCQ